MARLARPVEPLVEGAAFRRVRHHCTGPPSGDLAWQASVEDMETETAHAACRRSPAAATIGSPSVYSRGWIPTVDPGTRATATELHARRDEYRPTSERYVDPGSFP